MISGCSTAPPEPEFAPPVFPTPPAEPRFVFERTLRFSDNIIKPSTGEKLKRFATGAPRELKGLVKPYDIAVQDGRIYVTDTVQSSVIVFDIPAGRYFEFGKEEPGSLTKPTGIDISDEGEVFVSDVSAQRVMVYDPNGRFLRAIGDRTLLQRPSDVTVDSRRQRVYVVDTGGVASQQHGVQVFDLTSGQHLQTLGTRGRDEGQFNLPLQAAVAPDGTLYVVDSGNFRIQVFEPDGTYKFTFGSLGRLPGQFAKPKGIAIDAAGNIYVVDTAFGNFQIFNPKGQLLLFIGNRGNASKPATYMLPAGIEVDELGRIYVADQFFRKIDIFRPTGLDPDLWTVSNQSVEQRAQE